MELQLIIAFFYSDWLYPWIIAFLRTITIYFSLKQNLKTTFSVQIHFFTIFFIFAIFCLILRTIFLVFPIHSQESFFVFPNLKNHFFVFPIFKFVLVIFRFADFICFLPPKTDNLSWLFLFLANFLSWKICFLVKSFSFGQICISFPLQNLFGSAHFINPAMHLSPFRRKKTRRKKSRRNKTWRKQNHFFETMFQPSNIPKN